MHKILGKCESPRKIDAAQINDVSGSSRRSTLGPRADLHLSTRRSQWRYQIRAQQRYADLVFQLLDRLADRRLFREHGLGGLREAALPVAIAYRRQASSDTM
jgi:hypothetical protein